MATPADHAEENKTPPITACPACCIGYNADGPGGIGDHVHEAAPSPRALHRPGAQHRWHWLHPASSGRRRT